MRQTLPLKTLLFLFHNKRKSLSIRPLKERNDKLYYLSIIEFIFNSLLMYYFLYIYVLYFYKNGSWNTTKVRKNPSQLLSLTGFTVIEFEAFLPTFKHHWDEYYSHFTLKGKLRERISYSRKSSLLPRPEEKLLFILSYMKNNPLQDYHAGTFGITQPQCNVWIHRLSDIFA